MIFDDIDDWNETEIIIDEHKNETEDEKFERTWLIQDHEIKLFKVKSEQSKDIAQLKQLIEPYLECSVLIFKYLLNLNDTNRFQMNKLNDYIKCNANISEF